MSSNNFPARLPEGQCERPIYDENSAGADPELQAIIDKFAAKGVTVRYESLQSIADEGYDGDTEAQVQAAGDDYSSSLIGQCRWDQDNLIVGVVSNDPGYFNLQVDGQQEAYDNAHPSTFDDARDLLGSLLPDGSEPYQQDFAAALSLVYDRQFGEPLTDATPGVSVNESKPDSQPFISPIEVITGSGALILGALGVWQVVARRQVRKIAKQFESHPSTTQVVDAYAIASGMKGKEDTTEAILVMMNEEERASIDRLKGSMMEGFETWQADHLKTKESLAGIRKSFIPPRKSSALQIIKNYEHIVADYTYTAKMLTDAVAEAVHTWNERETVLADARTLHAQVYAEVQALTQPADGREHVYDASGLLARLDGFTAAFLICDEQIADNRAVEPYNTAMQIIEDLKSKQSFVANLPKFHADLAARAQELNTSHHAKLEVLHLTQDRVSSMLEEYDPTCWRTIEADLLTTSDALYSSQDLLEDVGDPSTEFSIDKLTKDFATLGAVEAKLETFDSYAAAIEKHHQRLSSLRESLPGSITGLRAEFEGAVAYIRANEIDITDTTEEEVVAHRARIEQLVTAIGQPKPQLLGIETELDKVKQAFEKSYKKAQDERQEIIDLLDSIDELQRQADKAIRGVRHYEDSNPDVDTETEDFIASLRLPQNPRSRDRALLRTARHELEYALASAQDAMRDARNDVDREQAKRAAALARQRAQRAEAARAASTPRFTSGGSSRRGSSNSGTFKPPKR